jgi:hypothetical protein
MKLNFYKIDLYKECEKRCDTGRCATWIIDKELFFLSETNKYFLFSFL